MKEGKTGGKGGGLGALPLSADERYTQCKSLVPVIYHWLANHNLPGPPFPPDQLITLFARLTAEILIRVELDTQSTLSKWSPYMSSVFGSSAEDGILNLWDSNRIGKEDQARTKASTTPPGLFFRLAGHRDKVDDFHWNASDPWTIVSVSDDGESSGGGGTLQIWRMIDLIYRPEEEVLDELDKFKTHLHGCTC